MKKVICFIIFITVCLTFIADEGEWELSLHDALLQTLKDNLGLKINEYTVLTAQEGIRSSKGYFDPTLTSNWSASVNRYPTSSFLQAGSSIPLYMSRNDVFNIGLNQYLPWGGKYEISWTNSRIRTNSRFAYFNPTYESGFSFSYEQSLLKGFGLKGSYHQTRKAKIEASRARDDLESEVISTLSKVETSYWELVRALKDMEVKKSALKLAEDFLKDTKVKVDVGLLAPIELDQARAAVADREVDVITAENIIKNIEDSLKWIMGMSEDSPKWHLAIKPKDEPEIKAVEYDEGTLISLAFKKRSEIRSIDKQLKSAKIDTDYAKNQMLPSLSLSTSLSYAGIAGDSTLNNIINDESFYDAWRMIRNRDYKSWSVGLLFSFPIPNRSTRSQYAINKFAETEKELALRDEKISVANEVKISLRNLQNAKKRVDAASANVELQTKKLYSEKKKYENGLSTSYQVLTFQEDLASAESTLLRAKADFSEYLGALNRSTGTYLDENHIELGGYK